MTYPVSYRTALARALGGSQSVVPKPGGLPGPIGRPANDNRIPGTVIPFPISAVRRSAGRTLAWGIDVTAGRAVSWLWEQWNDEDQKARGENPEAGPSTGAFIPAGSGWQHCWTCNDGDPITHQWSFNSGFGNCPPSTPGCLAGQALEGVMTPLGSAIPAHFGEYYWLSDNPVNPLETPMKMVAGFVRPAEGANTEVPLPVNIGPRVLPPFPITWNPPIGQMQIVIPRWPVAPFAPKPRPNEWPQGWIWGPIPGWNPWLRPEPVARPALNVGRSWMMRPRGRNAPYEIVALRPSLAVQPLPRPPRRNEREQKFVARGALGALVRLSYLGGEADDIIDELVDALDPKCVGGGSASKGRAAIKAAKSPQAKMALIHANMGCLNGAQALWNIITNQLEDKAIGGMNQLRNRGQRGAEAKGYIHPRPWLGMWRPPH